MPTERFTGKYRFSELEAWMTEMKRSALGFEILVSRTLPAHESGEAAVHVEYWLPEGSSRLYSKCIICGEFLLGRQLPEESPVLTRRGERLGT